MPPKRKTTSAKSKKSTPTRLPRYTDGHIDDETFLTIIAFAEASSFGLGLAGPPPLWPMIAHIAFHDVLGDLNAGTRPIDVDPKLIPEAARILSTPSRRMRFRAALFFRKALSVESPPIDAVIANGATPALSLALDDDTDAELQFEAAWALTNVASGSSAHTQHVVDVGCLPKFVRLLSSPDATVREQAGWALGNIAGEGASLRNLILDLNPLPALKSIITNPQESLSGRRNIMWTISNLVRSKPSPSDDTLKVVITIVCTVLATERLPVDTEITADAMWALSYATDTSDAIRDYILDNHSALLSFVVNQLVHPHVLVITPSLRTAGNFAAGNTRHTDAVVAAGILHYLSTLMSHPKRAIRKESCWALSNVLAEDANHVATVVAANLVPSILASCLAPEVEVRKEALWCLHNIASVGNTPDRAALLSANVDAALHHGIDASDDKSQWLSLQTVELLLQDTNLRDAFVAVLHASGTVQSIKARTSLSNESGEIAARIVETYLATS